MCSAVFVIAVVAVVVIALLILLCEIAALRHLAKDRLGFHDRPPSLTQARHIVRVVCLRVDDHVGARVLQAAVDKRHLDLGQVGVFGAFTRFGFVVVTAMLVLVLLVLVLLVFASVSDGGRAEGRRGARDACERRTPQMRTIRARPPADLALAHALPAQLSRPLEEGAVKRDAGGDLGGGGPAVGEADLFGGVRTP